MSNEVQLTEAQIDAIVDRAVEKTFNRVYQEVGKSILTKMAWLTGAAVVGLAMWLGGHNSLPK
jgi:tetrahydromethanopterin S-methyltransferase subunit G